MLEKIQDVIEDLQNSDEVDLCNEEARLQESLANDGALDRYTNLTKMPLKKINLGVKLENYHKYLKMSFNEDQSRLDFLNKLTDLDQFINEAGTNVSKEVVDDLRQRVFDLLKPLNMTYFSKNLETISSKKCLVLVEISTNPDIAEIGVADLDHQAEWDGIKKILYVLSTLLS